ncbi:hypothetical protein HK405_012749 [Cladochytrium tenue]|nr:hypothetical protein HK405_012749 [Cladochytrium tenue]
MKEATTMTHFCRMYPRSAVIHACRPICVTLSVACSEPDAHSHGYNGCAGKTGRLTHLRCVRSRTGGLMLTAWARALAAVRACSCGVYGVRLAVGSDELQIAAGMRSAAHPTAQEGQGFGSDELWVDRESAVAEAMFEGDAGSETSDDQ